MDKLPFEKLIEEYEAEYQINIDKKKAVIAKLQEDVDNLQKIINAKQCDYNAKPTTKLFQELLELKRQLEALKLDVKSADTIIEIPPINGRS